MRSLGGASGDDARASGPDHRRNTAPPGLFPGSYDARMKHRIKVDEWEQRTRTPLLLLAACFALAYAVPVLTPDAPAWIHTACRAVEWAVWAAFAGDYATRLLLTPHRGAFVRRGQHSRVVHLPLRAGQRRGDEADSAP